MTYDVVSTLTNSPSGIPVFEVHPVAAGPFPCFVVLHERYGLVEHTTDIASRLAAEGYCVLAPNLFFEYEDQEALRLATANTRVRDDRALEILDDVVTTLGEVANADPTRLGMLGACATGRYPVLWGANRPLDVCVVLHGLYANREWDPDGEFHLEPMVNLVGRMTARFLGLFGELDNMISVDDVRFIRDNFEACNKSYQISLYAGAPHGWMNSTMPARFRPAITEESWTELTEFLRTSFGRERRDDGLVEWRFTSSKHHDYDFTKNVGLR